jgi:hypothetical protein
MGCLVPTNPIFSPHFKHTSPINTMSNTELLIALGQFAEAVEEPGHVPFDKNECATTTLLHLTAIRMAHGAMDAALEILGDADTVMLEDTDPVKFRSKYNKCIADAQSALRAATEAPATSPQIGIVAFHAARAARDATDGEFLRDVDKNDNRHECVLAVSASARRLHLSVCRKMVAANGPPGDSACEPPLKKAAPSKK